MRQTKLKKINIESFRGLSDVDVSFGDRITVICGKNGTSKSTILGIAAQIFSYDTDYSKDPLVEISARTLHGEEFKSAFSDHFRLSKKYDGVSGAKIYIDLYDGYFDASPGKLQLSFTKSQDRPFPRPVVRNNITTSAVKNASRNVTHPVIYLSLSRLLPISQRNSYEAVEIEYLNANKERFYSLSNAILNKGANAKLTATKGDVSSAVAHGEHYDQDSVSSGEDNVGQIVSALMSFEKLKDESEEYHGGLLIIDEADAGLFPAAQTDFINLLTRVSKELKLQVIVSSHSPIIIREVHALSQKANKDYQVVYLTDTFGKIQSTQNPSWLDIITDLKTETVTLSDEVTMPELNTYFEDKEACDFFNKLVTKRDLRKPLNLLKDITLGCEHYKTLIGKGVKEFSEYSLIVFDADVAGVDKYSNCLKLPGSVPPDQLLFEYLIKKPSSDEGFWKNPYKFTKPVFLRENQRLLEQLGIKETDLAVNVDFCKLVNDRRPQFKNSVREEFKKFYQSASIQKLIKGKQDYNPFYLWAKDNPQEVKAFNERFVYAAKGIYNNAYKLDAGFLEQALE